jgi:arginine deiminase
VPKAEAPCNGSVFLCVLCGEKKENFMSGQNQPNVKELDLHQLLASVLQSNADSARVQRQLLDLELEKKQAAQAKDEDAKARIERDKKQLHEQMQIREQNKQNQIKSCPHTDQKGGSTIFPISNHPDRRLRGICTKCPIYIEPEHVETDARGKETLIAEHPLYQKVMQRDRDLYSESISVTTY